MKRQAAPVSAEQTHAIRRLANAGKAIEALARLDRLIALHPAYKPLYGLAWEISNRLDSPVFAIERALDWTRASPNSHAAWEALAEGALANGYPALGLFAQARLSALKGEPHALPTEPIDTGTGTMTFEEAVANDTGRVHLALGHFERALAAFTRHDHVALRNNLALTHFHLGEIGRALDEFEENWRREPENLFALGQIARLRLWMRGLDAAAGLAAPLTATPARRSDDALAKILALSLLGDWQGADAAWRESAQADCWDGVKGFKNATLFDYAGGVAAYRLGDFEAMSQRFDSAVSNDPTLIESVKRFEFALIAPKMTEAPEIALGQPNQWFPQSWLQRLSALKAGKAQEAEQGFAALMGECDAHPDYLGIAAELGGETVRALAVSVLMKRARAGDAASRRTLIDLLARPCGPDKVRTSLHVDLVEAGLLGKDEPVTMLVGGEKREILIQEMTLHAEVSPSELPPESHAQLEKTFDLMARRRLRECVPILEALIARHPEVPLLYNNLAGVLEGLGRPDEEIETLFQKAHAIDPDYLFALSGLARLAARRGEVERAKDMLEPLLGRKSYHFTEWRSILMTQIEIAHAQGEFATALRLQRQLHELQERFD